MNVLFAVLLVFVAVFAPRKDRKHPAPAPAPAQQQVPAQAASSPRVA